MRITYRWNARNCGAATVNKNLIRNLGLGLLTLMVLSGCASAPRWPAVADPPSGQHMPGRWVWMDLLTTDLVTAQQFYAQVFGWHFEPVVGKEDRYILVKAGDRAFAGMVQDPRPAQRPRKAHWLGFLSVADVDTAQRQASAAGGATKLAPRQLPGRGQVAVLADPEGAVFGIIDADGGDPPDTFPPLDTLLWMELWAADGERMAGFYQQLGGYQVQPRTSKSGIEEWHLAAFSYPRAGIVQVERADRASAWLPYVRVADLQATLARARAAGAEILLAPSPNIRHGQVAVIVDPLGAALGLAEWSEPATGDRQ